MTWMKSSGRNCSSMSHAGNRNDELAARPATADAPSRCRRAAGRRRSDAAARMRPARSRSRVAQRRRLRNTSATPSWSAVASPAMNSICGISRRASMPSISADKRADAFADLRDDRVAFGQVGDEARILLAETDQRLVLLLHAPHREAALAAVAPGGVGQWRQHRLRRDMADALEVFQQHALLGVDLLGFVEVLQRAAAAGAEVRAARRDAIGRGLQHLDGRALRRSCAGVRSAAP